AATDYVRAFADQIRAYVPRRYVVLGTDGFGRSDTREKLRSFFEVDRFHVAVAALKALADDGAVPAKKVAEAIEKYGVDANRPAPAPSGGNGQSAASRQAAAPAKPAPAAEARDRAAGAEKAPEEERPAPREQPRPAQPPAREEAAAKPAASPIESEAFKRAHASPSVRKFARELGVDLARVTGSGPKGRILQEDVQGFVKQAIAGGGAAAPG